MKFKKMEGPLETAVRLLAPRDHTEMELRLKLQRKKYETQEVDETIEKLREKGYLNDERITRRIIEKMVAERRHGLMGIAGKLRQLGLQVSNEQIRQYYSEDEEQEIAYQLVQKHFRSLEEDTFPRVARFLFNRGFSSAIMSRLSDEVRKHQ